jgi:hypothetical protein
MFDHRLTTNCKDGFNDGSKQTTNMPFFYCCCQDIINIDEGFEGAMLIWDAKADCKFEGLL